jgi:hypothetical protein
VQEAGKIARLLLAAEKLASNATKRIATSRHVERVVSRDFLLMVGLARDKALELHTMVGMRIIRCPP